MPKESTLEFVGEITELAKNAQFRVLLENGHTILAHASGKLRKNRIRCLLGDKVKIAISPYNLQLGRIIFRF